MKAPVDLLDSEMQAIRTIAASDNDTPILMLNLNKYIQSAGYPDGKLYRSYMQALHRLIAQAEAKILWQVPVLGQPIGEQSLDEILAAWYPSHKAFLSMTSLPGSKENFRLRELCIETAVIHRCAEGTVVKS